MPGKIMVGEFKGTLITEFPPANDNIKFGRIYIKILPIMMVFPIGVLIITWWSLGLFEEVPTIWVVVIAFAIVEPVTYLIIERALVTNLHPISFYSNGIVFKQSKLDMIRKMPAFLERHDMESISFNEYEIVLKGRYLHQAVLDVKLKNGRTIRLGNPNFENATKMKEIFENHYIIKVEWKKSGRGGRSGKNNALPIKVEGSSTKIQPLCVHCGKPMQLDSNFCIMCGGKQS